MPREKYPLGQTVTTPNEQRERTRMFTRRYLEEQLLTVLAGAARRPARPRQAPCREVWPCLSHHPALRAGFAAEGTALCAAHSQRVHTPGPGEEGAVGRPRHPTLYPNRQAARRRSWSTAWTS